MNVSARDVCNPVAREGEHGHTNIGLLFVAGIIAVKINHISEALRVAAFHCPVAMAAAPSAERLIPALQSLQYSTFVDVGAFSILIYDYFITFGDELDLMWPMSWRSPAKPLFFLTRYLPFVDMSVNIAQHFQHGLTATDCDTGAKVMGWFIYFGLMFSEVILTHRTWAVWEQKRMIGAGLLIWFLVIWIPQFVITYIFLNSLVYTTLPPGLPGCLAIDGNPIDFVDWVLLMVYEAGILTLMVIKAFQNHSQLGHSVVYKTVFRDGSVFYLYLFALSTLNIICILTFPDGMSQILTNFERVIHSVLTARILIALRRLGTRNTVLETLRVDSSINFELPELKPDTTTTDTSSPSSELGTVSTGRKYSV